MRARGVMAWVLVGLAVASRLGGVDATVRPSSVRFANNAYTGVVVAIHDKVEESQELIDQITVRIYSYIFLPREWHGTVGGASLADPYGSGHFFAKS